MVHRSLFSRVHTDKADSSSGPRLSSQKSIASKVSLMHRCFFSFGIEHSGEGSDELHRPQMNTIPHESKFFGGHGCSYMSYLYLDIESAKYKYGGLYFSYMSS